MKKIIIAIYILSFISCTNERKLDFPDYPISNVDIRKVKLKDNFWLPKIKLVQDTTIAYSFKKCEEEGRVDNFLVAGGIKQDTVRGKMPFDDTDIYKTIEGASYSLISKPNQELSEYLDALINIISIGQEPDGYLTTWFTIDRTKPPAWWVKPSEERWGSLDASHELYNSGHMFEAAAAHYWATGKKNFLNIAIKNADLLVDNFGPEKLRIPPGHQIVETGLIKLYNITQNKNYLDLAKFFLEARGDSTTHKLYGEYSQDHVSIFEQDEAVGHSVRALYMYAGMTDIAAINKDKRYLSAINKIWDNAVGKKMYVTGGMGSKHGTEAYGENYEMPNLTAYNETCAAIGSIYWNHRLFLLTGDSKYYDILERTLYNGMIAGISLDGKKFFYPNPTESDGEYKFNMGACTRQSWFDCSCCPTNIIRFVPSIPGLIYAAKNDTVYVNMYSQNSAEIQLNDEIIKIDQETSYPWNGNVKVKIECEGEKYFTTKLRIPGWAMNKPVPNDLYSYIGETDDVIIKVNGAHEKNEINNGYVSISREWKKGDLIEIELPMKIRQVIAHKNVKDNNNKVALEYGPIVYCAEEIDNENFSDLKIDESSSFGIKKDRIKSENFMKIEVQNNDYTHTLIPYYLWSNRGVNKMKVWFPKK